MATSGSFSKVFSTGYTLKVEWSESNVDQTNNQSDITVTVKLIAASGYWIESTASKNISLTINGTKYSSTCTVGIDKGATKTLMTKTVSDITHSSDGSKTVSISCTLDIAVTLSGTYVSSVSASGSAKLTTIARKSSMSASNGTLGTAQTLTVSRQSSSFTHTITYKCGSASGTVCTKSSSTSISWTPPLSLAAQNTTGTSVSITFTITTYNGDTSIGSNTKTISCAIPSSVAPTCTIAVEDAAGYSGTYGWLKSLSKIKYNVTATKAQGSDIASYSVSANGQTYTTASGTTGVISSFGTITVKVTVKDKRGRTGTASTSITVVDYVAPKINKLSIKRCNSDGTENAQGEYIAVTYDCTISSLSSKNTAKHVLKYKKSTDTSYTSVTLSTAYTASGTKIVSADSGSSYDIVIESTDAFKTVSKTTSGSTGFALFHFLKTGLGIAFGKIAELDNYLDIGFKTFFRDALYLTTNKAMYCADSNGDTKEIINPLNSNGNLVIGWGNYDSQSGNTHIYGHDVQVGVSNLASPGTYRPYVRQGDTIDVYFSTAGFVTNGGKDVLFLVPFTRPIIGSPTVTASSVNGFRLRQNNSYTHGSSTTAQATPSSYSASLYYNLGVVVTASFDSTTNVTNNSPIGITWSGKLTFS